MVAVARSLILKVCLFPNFVRIQTSCVILNAANTRYVCCRVALYIPSLRPITTRVVSTPSTSTNQTFRSSDWVPFMRYICSRDAYSRGWKLEVWASQVPCNLISVAVFDRLRVPCVSCCLRRRRLFLARRSVWTVLIVSMPRPAHGTSPVSLQTLEL